MSLDRVQGAAFTDKFTATASNWSDADTPLEYKFTYKKESSKASGILLRSYSASATASFYLPPGKWLVCALVRDSVGAESAESCTSSSGSVTVSAPVVTTEADTVGVMTSGVGTASQLMSAGDVDGPY